MSCCCELTFRTLASGATGPRSGAKAAAAAITKVRNSARLTAGAVNTFDVSFFSRPDSRRRTLTVTFPSADGEAVTVMTDRAAASESARVMGCTAAIEVASISGAPPMSVAPSLSRTASDWAGGKYTGRRIFSGAPLAAAAADAATRSAIRRAWANVFTIGTRTRGRARARGD